MLDEIDTNETNNIESKSFDELLGELKKHKIKIVKSGTIKALNKQRVIAKHYGQLTEPMSVVNYFTVAITFTNTLLQNVVGRTLDEILVTDVLNQGITKELVETAIIHAEKEQFLNALEYLRRAFYLSYENQYSIYNYRTLVNPPLSLRLFTIGGEKAPHWTKNKAWILENVKTPLDYIQINHEQLKSDCIEWGVSTASVENFRRLTPKLVQTEHDHWHIDYTTSYAANELNNENFKFCLELLLDFLLKKQEFESSHKWPKTDNIIPAPPIYVGKNIYQNASTESKVEGVVQSNYYYNVLRIVTGFNIDEEYLYVHLYPIDTQDPNGYILNYGNHIHGYLLNEDGKNS